MQVERVRLFLRLRQCLKGKKTKDDGEIKTPLSPTKPKWPIPFKVELSEREASIAQKVIQLIKRKVPMNKEPPTGKVIK